MDDRVVDTAAACRILGCGRTKLAELKRKGAIKPVPYHRSRFDRDGLYEYLDQVRAEQNKPKESGDNIDDIVSARLQSLKLTSHAQH